MTADSVAQTQSERQRGSVSQEERLARWFDLEPGPLATAALGLFHEAVGVWPGSSPGSTGVWLMDELAPRSMQRQPVLDWPAPALRQPVQPLSQVYPLHSDERRLRYVHAYDKNAQYLGAAGAAVLGLGDLAHDRPAHLHSEWGGYYRLDVDWHCGPFMRWRLDDGEELAEWPLESYVWRCSGRALRPWYERLRAARAALLADDSEAARYALLGVKRMYTQAIGWLDGGWFRARGEMDDPRFRPDWRHTIIDLANCNLERTMAKCAGVLAVHIDCLWIASDEPDAWVAAPDAIKIGQGLGEFKVRYQAIPMSEYAAWVERGVSGLKLVDLSAPWAV